MLRLFGGGGDHPLRNAREAQRILGELPADDVKALDELAHWFESVASAEGFKLAERISVLAALDDAGLPRARKLAREYFAATRPSRFQESRLWTALHDYWKHAAHALGHALEPKAGAAAAARAIRAGGQQVKWQHLRYAPGDPAAWGVMNGVFQFAEAASHAEAKLEYMKALMLSTASPDSLVAVEIDMAERVIADIAAGALLEKRAAPGLPYWVDLARPAGPSRAMRSPEPSPTLRFFGAGDALPALQGMIQKLQAKRELPPSLSGVPDLDAALEVLLHLALVWSPEPPERRHVRHNVRSRLTVVHGFDAVLSALDDAPLADFEQRRAESWVVENVSSGGFGAAVPQMKSDWLRVGSLLALQPEGGTNWLVGIVRRVSRGTGSEARVGIETLSRAPRKTAFRVRGLGTEPGVLLPSVTLGSNEVAVLLRGGVYPPGQNLDASVDGREQIFVPIGRPEQGEDYDLMRFRQLVRES